MSQILDVTALPALASLGAEAGTTAYGEVLAADGHRASVDAGRSGHVGRGRDAFEPVVLVVFARARQGADLAEAAGVREPLDAFAHREPPGLMLAADVLLAAHGHGGLPTLGQLVDLFVPGPGTALHLLI